MLQFILVILFSVGCFLTVSSLLLLIPVRRRTRMPILQFKRKEDFHKWMAVIIDRENRKPSNDRLRSQLKLAGNPVGLTVFRYRVLQMVAPLGVTLLTLVMNLLSKFLWRSPDDFPMMVLLMLVGTSYLIPMLGLHLLAKRRKDMLMAEIIKFSHRLVVSINEQIQLYYAIKRAGRTCIVIKPYVDHLLLNWLQDPQQAIRSFAEDVGIHEILPITNTLLATWNAPQDKIIDLFHHQIRNIDTMRDFQVKKSIEVSPLRVTFTVVIPFMFTIGLILLPWYMDAIALMQKAF